MQKRLSCTLLVILFMLFTLPLAWAAERTPVTIEEGSPLPLRVLVRPGATLFGDAYEANIVDSNVPTFKPYYVYTRPGGETREGGSGWYEVGTDEKGSIAGWLKASDVFEWRQTMCLAYSHPENRQPVLMFEDRQALEALLQKASDQRRQDAQGLYASINAAPATPLAETFPVISVEPKMAVDMVKQFYLLPILEHAEVTLDNYEGRVLRLAAVSGKAQPNAEQASDIRKNPDYTRAATAAPASAAGEDILYDVVWVIDTTRSMQPYIDEVRNTMQAVSQALSQAPDMGGRFHFGLHAYRDSEDISGIEYVTHNMTPDLLPVDAFLSTLAGVKETTVDSVDVEEDMFAGVHDAITKTKWRDGAVRLIVLVGDAPSHMPGHKWNSTKMDEKTLRTLATENRVTIFGIHVRPTINKRYNNLAEKQWRALSANPGTTESAYWGISAADKQFFATATQKITQHMQSFLTDTRAGKALAAKPEAEGTPPAVTQADAASAAPTSTAPRPDAKGNVAPSDADIRHALRAATVTWLGSAANVEPPRDIEAWVTDKDLLQPATQSLEVRLLVSKRQLDSMAGILGDIIAAGRQNQSASEDFFTSLQSVSAAASRNADQVARAKTLQEAGLVPAFLQGLPYKSQIMSMSSELWASFGPDEQDQFIEGLVAKVEAYKSLHNTPDQWVALNAADAADDYVTPIPLDLLP